MLHAESSWKYRQFKYRYQTRTAIPVRSPHYMNRKVLKKESSEVTIEKCYKRQNLLSSIANKEIN
jgi:hypothetical protein